MLLSHALLSCCRQGEICWMFTWSESVGDYGGVNDVCEGNLFDGCWQGVKVSCYPASGRIDRCKPQK